MKEASSINFRRSVTYGLRTLEAVFQFYLARMGLIRPAIFQRDEG